MWPGGGCHVPLFRLISQQTQLSHQCHPGFPLALAALCGGWCDSAVVGLPGGLVGSIARHLGGLLLLSNAGEGVLHTV